MSEFYLKGIVSKLTRHGQSGKGIYDDIKILYPKVYFCSCTISRFAESQTRPKSFIKIPNRSEG